MYAIHQTYVQRNKTGKQKQNEIELLSKITQTHLAKLSNREKIQFSVPLYFGTDKINIIIKKKKMINFAVIFDKLKKNVILKKNFFSQYQNIPVHRKSLTFTPFCLDHTS